MLINYLKTAWRNLLRNKTYAAINISGLGIGLFVCMLIIQYEEHESGYDSFHANAARMYWIQGKMKMGSDSFMMPYMSSATAPLAKQNDPSVESYARLMWDHSKPVIENIQSSSAKFIDDNFLFADSNFFRFFSFPLRSGSADAVLKNPFTVVISKSAAKKFFGTENPVGHIIRYSNAYNFTITGIADDAPSNSSITYDFVASFSSLSSIETFKPVLISQTVQLGGFGTYFLLKQKSDAPHLEQTLNRLNKSGNQESNETYYVTPFTDTHVKANYGDSSNTKYLSIFPFVAALVLLLALTNYVSLSTARSTVRAREVGVRKAMGASKGSIAKQFFIESSLYTGIAFMVAFLLCTFFQPVFFSFLQIHIDSSFLYSPALLLSFAVLFILTVVLAAAYPSLLLSAYQPVKVLYGKFSRQSGGLRVRRFFTVFQFAISVVFIICGIVVARQINYIQHADTGVNKSNVVMIPFAPSIGAHYNACKQEIASLSGVQQTTAAHYPMYKGYDAFFTKANGTQQDVSLPVLNVDENFISLLGLQWKTEPVDAKYIQKGSVIINEAAIAKLNLGRHPLGQLINLGNESHQVAGVLKNFNYESLQNKINALCLLVKSDTASNWSEEGGCLFARLKPHTNVHSTMEQIKTIYEKHDKAKPFEFSFLDDTYNNMYAAEERLSKLLFVFITLTILLACLGLLGLATFMAVQRTKEIGIRKVLGATVAQVAVLLSKDFIRLVLAGICIAVPVSWWLMNKWLQSFAYRTSIGVWIFVAAGFVTVLLAIITVSFQSVKTATANPAKSLRTE